MRRLFLFVLAFALITSFLLGASSCSYINSYIDLLMGKGEQLKFISNGDGTCTVVGNKDLLDIYSTIEEIEIPSVSPDGDKVTSIGKDAFHNYRSLENITIPDSVSSIGRSAFFQCRKLANIEVSENNPFYMSIEGNLYSRDGKTLVRCAPAKIAIDIADSVTKIDEGAFEDCERLASIVFSDSMISIGSGLFGDCTNLMSVTVSKGIKSIESSAFFYCNKIVEIINHSSLNINPDHSYDYGDISEHAIEVHSGKSKLVNQDDYMFYTYADQNYLVGYVGTDSKLELPGNYKGQNYAIYDNAFTDYWGISDIVIPEGVTSIGKYAFNVCLMLKSITIPKSVTSIGNAAFCGCPSLEKVIFKGTMEEWRNISFGIIGAFDLGTAENFEIICSDGTIQIK